MTKSKSKAVRSSNRNDRCGRDELLNHGLSLAMEWGEDWLKPIQERLLRYHPWLQADQADEINGLAQEAMRLGHHLLYKSVEAAAYGYASCREMVMDKQEFEGQVRARYEWVNEENISHLYAQGRYYAWKDFGL